MARIRYAARPDDEVENSERDAAKVGAWSTSLTATYETDIDVVKAVLPPPLEATDSPHVRISIGKVDLGRGMPSFGAGTFAVAAAHEQTTGWYPLLMPMTSETAVVGGRETFGEPKKLADMEVSRDGDDVRGTVARMGTTIIEIAGRVTEELEPPPERDRLDYYFKYLPRPDGDGFDAEPSLVYCHRHETTRKIERVDGDITLRDSQFDPVADIPVRSILDITLSERQSSQQGEIIARVPGELVLPYMHQRYDILMRAIAAEAAGRQ